MLKNIIKCGLVGGIIFFAWTQLLWLLPFQRNQIKAFAHEETVRQCIKANAPESGLYQLPSMKYHHGEAKMEGKKEQTEGPFFFGAVLLEGKNFNRIGHMASTLVLDLISAFIIAWLLFQTRLDYKKSVVFITVIGLLVGLVHSIPNVIWVGFPLNHAFASILRTIIGWLLAGLAMAKMSRK